MTDGVLTPEPAGITTGADAATDRTSPVCSCGAGAHSTHAGICEKGHAMRGNQLHRVHGLYSYLAQGDRAIPADLRMSADDMLAGLLADKGGAESSKLLTARRRR